MSIRPIPTIAHAVALNTLIFGYVQLANMDTPTDNWIRSQKGGHWQYLTVQALMIAVATFGFSILADLLPKSTVIARAKRLTAMISLPTAAAVSGIYWTLIFLAPSLILPPAIDSPKDSNSPINLASIPFHIDIIVHLMPAVFLTLDFYLLERKYTKKDVQLWAPLVTLVFTVWYGSWVEWLNTFNNRFPYPFLNVPFQYRLPIYIGAATLGYLSFRQLNSWHSGQALLGGVEAVQMVVEPERQDRKTK